MRRITIKDVAKHLDISIATVSLALKGDTRIAENTRKSVREAAAQLGYTYNRQAANLRMGRSDIIAVCINDLHNPVYNQVLISVEKRLNEKGWMLLLCNSREDIKRQNRFLRKMREMSVAGVLLAPASDTSAQEVKDILHGLPTMLFSRSLPGDAFDSVTGNDALGIKLVVDHLYGRGHRNIGWIGSNLGSSTARSRKDAFETFVSSYGLKVDEQAMAFIGNTRQEGYEAAARILAHDPQITALVCFGDPMALGALAYARKHEQATGHKISVTGYDDVDEALFSEPRLTSVCQAKEEIGILAADLLLEKIENPESGKQGNRHDHVLDPILSIRESTYRVSQADTVKGKTLDKKIEG